MEKLLDNSYYNDLYQVASSTDEEKDFDSDIDEAELLIKQPKDKDKFKRQRIPYPKSVFFIIGNEFCERLVFLLNEDPTLAKPKYFWLWNVYLKKL